MIYEVLGGAAAVLGDGERKRAVRDPNAAVLSEAYPESEYNLNPEAASAGALLQGCDAAALVAATPQFLCTCKRKIDVAEVETETAFFQRGALLSQPINARR